MKNIILSLFVLFGSLGMAQSANDSVRTYQF